MGRGYVIEHCMATLNHIQEQDAYKRYVADVLRYIAKGVGYEINISYGNIISRMRSSVVEDTRTADEIIDSLRKKAGAINDSIRADSKNKT